jgi:hypothetical protein
MIGINLFGLLNLIQHIRNIKHAKYIEGQSATRSFFSIIFNVGISWGGIWGFGRPYSPAFIYIVGLLVTGIIECFYSQLIQWMEKLSVNLSIFRPELPDLPDFERFPGFFRIITNLGCFSTKTSSNTQFEEEQQDSDDDPKEEGDATKEIRPDHLWGVLLSLKPTPCPNLHKFISFSF